MADFLQASQPVLQILQWIAVGLFFVLMLYMRSVFVARKDHDALEKRVQTVETTIALIGHQMKQGPTAKDLHELNIAIERLTGQLGVTNERMSGMEDLQKVFKHQVDRMEEFLAKNR
ncbi:DUF2730 family protein [Dongia deserti]|uniref:DUF2730 family protein n=1 Tax=Dongia deserti TaxID=2268030 RepID=UPI000E64DE63|nr:DUF2730 family protein [Dongia deserti]